MIFTDDLAVTDSILKKGRCIIIHNEQQKQDLEHLNNNHKGIEKKLPAYGAIYWISMNAAIKICKKTVLHILSFSTHRSKRK